MLGYKLIKEKDYNDLLQKLSNLEEENSRLVKELDKSDQEIMVVSSELKTLDTEVKELKEENAVLKEKVVSLQSSESKERTLVRTSSARNARKRRTVVRKNEPNK